MSEKTCHGSCLCGTVRWTVTPPYSGMSHCHCSMCRKAHGAPFATYMGAKPENLTFESGEEAIVSYESSPGFTRTFCGSCGSAVPGVIEGVMDIPAGCLDDDPGVRPDRHIFATHKAPWHVIADDLPQWQTYKEDGTGTVVERPDPGAPSRIAWPEVSARSIRTTCSTRWEERASGKRRSCSPGFSVRFAPASSKDDGCVSMNSRTAATASSGVTAPKMWRPESLRSMNNIR